MLLYQEPNKTNVSIILSKIQTIIKESHILIFLLGKKQ